MQVETIIILLELFPDAEVVAHPDGSFTVRRAGKRVTTVREDGTFDAVLAKQPRRYVGTATC